MEHLAVTSPSHLHAKTSPSPRQLWWRRLQRLRNSGDEDVGGIESATQRPNSSPATGSGSRCRLSAVTPRRPQTSPAVGQQNLAADHVLQHQSPAPFRRNHVFSEPQTRPSSNFLAEFGPLFSKSLDTSLFTPDQMTAEDSIGEPPRIWNRAYQNLMEAYWSMDFGALLASGPQYRQAISPSWRRRNLQALFRGRMLMAACAAEGLREQGASPRCKSDESDFALSTSPMSRDGKMNVSPSDCEARGRRFSKYSSFAESSFRGSLADPDELPCNEHSNAGANTDVLLAAAIAESPAIEEPQTVFARDASTKALSFALGLSKMPSSRSRLPRKVRSDRNGFIQGMHPNSMTASLTSLGVLPRSPSASLGGKAPRRKPKPLSQPPVAGKTRWLKSSDGCVMEVAVDPKKAQQVEASGQRAGSKSSSHERLPTAPHRRASVSLGRKSTITGSFGAFSASRRRKEEEKEKEKEEEHNTPERQLMRRMTVTLGIGIESIENLRAGMADFWMSGIDEKAMGEEDGGTNAEKTSRFDQRDIKKLKNSRVTIAPGGSGAEADSCSSHSPSPIPPPPPHRKSLLKDGRRKGDNEKSEFRYLVGLSRKYHISLDDLKDAREKFRSHDSQSLGELTLEEFKSLIRDCCNLPEDSKIPFHLMHAARLEEMDSSNPMVSFEDFLMWTLNCAYSEEMMVPNLSERHIRKLAREIGMLLPDVEKIKELFDLFDVDGSGEIEEDEFKQIVFSMMGVKNEADVSEKRLHRYWREIDAENKGAVGFDTFLGWYCRSGFGETLV